MAKSQRLRQQSGEIGREYGQDCGVDEEGQEGQTDEEQAISVGSQRSQEKSQASFPYGQANVK